MALPPSPVKLLGRRHRELILSPAIELSIRSRSCACASWMLRSIS